MGERINPLPAPRAVGILGGMGPAAGADFVRLFVEACTDWLRDARWPVSDQAFPPHWLVQLPVPDRTQAIRHGGEAARAPLAAMSEAMGKLRAVGVCAVAMACNTAHAWHAELQSRFADLELLHVAQEVGAALQARGTTEVALLATEGSYRQRLYDDALARVGIVCRVPRQAEVALLMDGIYEGVKRGDLALAEERFVTVARRLRDRHGEVPLIMGCTEIPLALDGSPAASGWPLVNPARELARALARRAYEVHETDQVLR
jgi:aspartate racemase